MTLRLLREDARANINSLKARQVGFQKYVDDCQPLEAAKQESFERILAMYLPLLEKLGPRRSDEINSASRMLKNHPAQRASALREFSRKARIQVEQARQSEKQQTLRFLSSDIKNYCVSYDWYGLSSYRGTQDGVGNQCFCISPQYIHRWPLVIVHVPSNGTGIMLAQNRIFLYVLKMTVFRDLPDGDGDIQT